jgi:hypothetical protein
MGHFQAWGDRGFSPGLSEEDVEQWYGKDKDGRGHDQAEIHLPARVDGSSRGRARAFRISRTSGDSASMAARSMASVS